MVGQVREQGGCSQMYNMTLANIQGHGHLDSINKKSFIFTKLLLLAQFILAVSDEH